MNKRTHKPPRKGIYHGSNIHAYTEQLKKMSIIYTPDIYKDFGNTVENTEWVSLMKELTANYGKKRAINNMNRNYKNGWIKDPEVPQLNSAVLLKALWTKIKNSDTSIKKHFGETLDQIAGTCIQGVSHRLFLDYVALVNDEECVLETVIKSDITSLIDELIIQIENKGE